MDKRTITAADIKVGDNLYVVANNQMETVEVSNIVTDTNGRFFEITISDCKKITKMIEGPEFINGTITMYNCFYSSPDEDNRTDLLVSADHKCDIGKISIYTDPAIAYQNLRTMCLDTLDALKKKYNVD